jgi:uncharacterized membrane protein AbrB (regulator of aidB expression)
VVLCAGVLFIHKFNGFFSFSELTRLSLVFTLLVLLTLVIFFRGESQEPESRTMHNLVSVSLKFLLELILAFIWFFIAKKTSLPSVILFFVIYLTFTLFYVITIVKTLKNKSI